MHCMLQRTGTILLTGCTGICLQPAASVLCQQQVNKSGCLQKAVNSPDSSKLTGGQSSLDLLRVVGTSGLLSCSSRSYTKAVRLGRNIMLAGALNGLNRALYTACPVGVTNLISCASAVRFTHTACSRPTTNQQSSLHALAIQIQLQCVLPAFALFSEALPLSPAHLAFPPALSLPAQQKQML